MRRRREPRPPSGHVRPRGTQGPTTPEDAITATPGDPAAQPHQETQRRDFAARPTGTTATTAPGSPIARRRRQDNPQDRPAGTPRGPGQAHRGSHHRPTLARTCHMNSDSEPGEPGTPTLAYTDPGALRHGSAPLAAHAAVTAVLVPRSGTLTDRRSRSPKRRAGSRPPARARYASAPDRVRVAQTPAPSTELICFGSPQTISRAPARPSASGSAVATVAPAPPLTATTTTGRAAARDATEASA